MKTKSLIVGLTALTVAAVSPAATVFAGYYPENRATFTCNTPTDCPGANYVTFNSFTNNPVVGDERPFFSGSLNGAAVQDRIKVQNGEEIVLRAYVHNNANPNAIGAAAARAKNVRIRVLVPNDSKADHNLTAFITAANANPGTVNDTMSLYGDKAFTLEYVAGSASFAHKADGQNMQTDKVDDTVIAGNGASLGDINGCFDYSGYVTLKVKVNMPGTPETPKTPPTTTTTQTPAQPTTLVNTGAGDVLGLVAGVTILGAVVRRLSLSRR